MKLCFKEYPYKMTLGAMKQFKQATNKDLWCTLLQFMENFRDNASLSTIARMQKLYEVVDFETASHVFHSLIRAEDTSIPLVEIEDAMFRVGWLPTERPGDMSEPWPLVMVGLANEISKQFESDTSEAKK